MNRTIALLLCTLAQSAAAAEPYFADAALRGYFYAGSENDPRALGGYGTSDNHPRPIDRAVPPAMLSLIALPDEAAAFRDKRGFRVVLANTTRDTIALDASDSRLNIVREALDLSGQWRAIEYLPGSWCGNSHHRVFLPQDHQWVFAAPEYAGTYRTRMRFVLTQGTARVYSNEFEGSMSLGQFEKKEGHTPAGIMDPYNN